MGKSTISIIMTTCCTNQYRMQLLSVSIRSFIQNTDMSGKQWIICDNGNEQQTEYLKTFQPHEHLIFGENKGIAYARNAGAEVATGDYLCFVDNDFIYKPLWLRIMKKFLDKANNKYIASGMVHANWAAIKRQLLSYGSDHHIWTKANSGCLMMTREIFDLLGPWDDFWKLGSKFSRRAAKKKIRFIVPIPEVVAHLDYKSSYDKWELRQSIKRGEVPQWQMV